jgi:hypothetical protein
VLVRQRERADQRTVVSHSAIEKRGIDVRDHQLRPPKHRERTVGVDVAPSELQESLTSLPCTAGPRGDADAARWEVDVRGVIDDDGVDLRTRPTGFLPT